MKFWETYYPDDIITLDYEALTENHTLEIKKLIEDLNLIWDDGCINPEKNKKFVKTASQQQIRKRIYKNSSAEWKKFKPYLDGIFDELSH